MHDSAIAGFIAALERALAGAGAPADGFRADLPSARADGRSGSAPSARLPACRFLDAAFADAAPAALALPLAALMPALAWTQNPNYRRAPPDPRFLDSYAYAVIAGPAAGAPALARCEALAVGVLLLGPHTHYPRHAHPAEELYLPLNPAEWWRGEGPWTTQPPGTLIHHAPNVPHATRTGAGPLLAIYLWRGDLATHAQLARAAVE
jgi:hypothetical protein